MAHINIHPKQSPASRAFNGSAYVTPLPSRLRPKKEQCRDTPHPSASGSCQYFTHPNIHRFLHLPRCLVYIYSRPKSVYDRVTWGSGGYLPTTSPLRLHVLQDGGVRSTIPIFTAALTYVYSHIPSSKNKSFKNF